MVWLLIEDDISGPATALSRRPGSSLTHHPSAIAGAAYGVPKPGTGCGAAYMLSAVAGKPSSWD